MKVTPRPSTALASLLEAKSVDDLAKRYEAILIDTVRAWAAGKLNGPENADRVRLVNDILASPVLAARIGQGAANKQLDDLLRSIGREEAALPAPQRGLAMADGTGINERVHIRGNHRSLGEEAPRRLPILFGADQPLPPSGSGRHDMAQRLTAPDNPLVARVIVNRLWQHHFGSGIVRTPDDLGYQGDEPTHPELLDWLARELIASDWSLKHVHRLIVTSSAYRMSSREDEVGGRVDPRNELLHRMPIRRLEAEAIRDALLAVSGRLNRTMGGPGPLPYLTEFTIGRGRPGASGPLDGAGRRSVYLNVRRNFLNPMFQAFDYPVPFTAIGRRSVSNVPAQALTMLNNPLVTQQARLWAEQVLAVPGRSDADRVAAMYETAFGRLPTAEEQTEALTFLAEQGKEYGKPDVRAWTDLAHVLFNVKEFVFVN
jgi:hypothetical protein